MKKKFLLSLLLVSLLAVSIASAFWPFDKAITGNVVSERVMTRNPGFICEDSDGGGDDQYILGGAVKYAPTELSSRRVFVDACSGRRITRYNNEGKRIRVYAQIKEMTCDDENKVVAKIKGEDDLGEGYCVKEKLELFGRTRTVAKWVSNSALCRPVSGGVVDGSGTFYKNGCGVGASRNIYTSYTCNGSEVVVNSRNCSEISEFGRCTSQGCVGNCVEVSDEENDVDIPGVVVKDRVNYLDVCSDDGRKVKQYRCVRGNARAVSVGDSVWASCGKDRECAVDSETGAGYCRDKTDAEDITTLEGLRRIVQSLQERVADLEQQINGLISG